MERKTGELVGGGTVAQYCEQRGIPRSSFIKWRGTLMAEPVRRTKRPASGFLSVPIRTSPGPSPRLASVLN
jgi:hypothetical protein